MKKKRGRRSWYRLAGGLAGLTILGVLLWPLFDRQGSPELNLPAKPAVLQAKPNPELAAVIREYEHEVRTLMQRTNFPGAAIAIVKDSTILYTEGFGLRSTQKKDSINEHTVFRLASVSKCFASFLTGILVEEGKLQWNDPVVKYATDFALSDADHTQEITITHVLSHTTGLPYHTYTNMVEEGLPLNELLGKLKDIKIAAPLGVEYSYQNVAYSVISDVVQGATGLSYEKQMAAKVFQPLGMNDASMDYASFVNNDNIAQPHRMARKRWAPASINNTYYNVAPAGGINASISDMAKWMVALLGEREKVISHETMGHLYKPVVSARSKNRNYLRMERGGKSYYGLGWRILHYPTDTLVYHGGYVTGYRSEVAFDPHDRIAICILANAPGDLPDTAIPLFFDLYRKNRDRIIEWERNQRR